MHCQSNNAVQLFFINNTHIKHPSFPGTRDEYLSFKQNHGFTIFTFLSFLFQARYLTTIHTNPITQS
jgi:hypothetical protein